MPSYLLPFLLVILSSSTTVAQITIYLKNSEQRNIPFRLVSLDGSVTLKANEGTLSLNSLYKYQDKRFKLYFKKRTTHLVYSAAKVFYLADRTIGTGHIKRDEISYETVNRDTDLKLYVDRKTFRLDSDSTNNSSTNDK